MKTILSNASYDQYLEDGLENLSRHFNIKAYKRASKENQPYFQRGVDLRIQIRWKQDCIWEFLIEKQFWYQRNTNKEDRRHMRNCVNPKIQACKNALVKKKPTKTKKTKSKKRVGQTQELFEKMKTK